MFHYKKISQILTVSIVASMLLTNTSFASEPVECEHSFTYTPDGDNSHIATCELCGETYSEMCDMVEMDIPSCDGGENDAIYYHCELCGNTRTEEMIPMDGPVEEVVEDEPIDEESGTANFRFSEAKTWDFYENMKNPQDPYWKAINDYIGKTQVVVHLASLKRGEDYDGPISYPRQETFTIHVDESNFNITGKQLKAAIAPFDRHHYNHQSNIDYTRIADANPIFNADGTVTITIPFSNDNPSLYDYDRDYYEIFFYTDYIPVERIEVDKTYRDEYFDNIDGLFLCKEQSVEQLPIKYYPENATIRRLTITGPDNGVHFSRDWGGTPVGSVHLQNGLIYVSGTTVSTGYRETLTLTSYDNPKTSDTCTVKSSPTGKFIPIKNTTQMFY